MTSSKKTHTYRKLPQSGRGNTLKKMVENLDCQWRGLHTFELPEVRHPTDATPPNQRRL